MRLKLHNANESAYQPDAIIKLSANAPISPDIASKLLGHVLILNQKGLNSTPLNLFFTQ